MTICLQDRTHNYKTTFPDFPPLHVIGGKRIEGLWIMGQNYKTSGYYGAYLHGYLKRVKALFFEAKPELTLHAPSGSLPPGDGLRIDIRPECNPDIVGDCHDLISLVGKKRFNHIFADIPYSVEDAEHYGKPMVQRNKVFSSCLDVLRPGGFVVWLDQVFPQFSKTEVDLMLCIGMIKSTNHRVRAVWGFQKKAEKDIFS